MELYPHQIDALNETAGRHKVAYYHDMGLGKTFTGAEKLHRLGGRLNLVICQKSKISDWMQHFIMYYDYRICDLTKLVEYRNFLGMLPEERSPPMIGVINYDLVFRRPELLDVELDTLLLDESSVIQNDTAKRTKAVLKMKHKNIILLSGTPTGGKYENLYSQLKLLGWKITKTQYYSEFINTRLMDVGGVRIPIVTGYKNVPRLKKKMRLFGCHFLLTDEVFDLPQQNFTDMEISVSKEYRKFCKSRIVTVGQHELVGDTVLTQMLYQRMLCGAYSGDKLHALEDLLESSRDRLIIFYNFDEELLHLREVCKHHKRQMSEINGKCKDMAAYENAEDSVTLIQYQSGAMGLNLQKANKIVYFTPPLSSELYEQSKKRIHRIGQERPCFYYRMICKNSIEERIYAVLKKRQNFTERLFLEE